MGIEQQQREQDSSATDSQDNDIALEEQTKTDADDLEEAKSITTKRPDDPKPHSTVDTAACSDEIDFWDKNSSKLRQEEEFDVLSAHNKLVVENLGKEIKYYQASSSEMYGGVSTDYLDENSIFDPKSPYAAGKVFAHHMTKIYRESYNLFCVNGILFNHESPERGETFEQEKLQEELEGLFMVYKTIFLLEI